MLYDIKLSIQYVYRAPVAGGRHVLYMTPSQVGPQRVITSLLDMGMDGIYSDHVDRMVDGAAELA